MDPGGNIFCRGSELGNGEKERTGDTSASEKKKKGREISPNIPRQSRQISVPKAKWGYVHVPGATAIGGSIR
jgi:hypothetical protein